MRLLNVRDPANSFQEELDTFAEYQLDSCIGDGECMRVCPVVDQNLTIAELNESTQADNPISKAVLTFTYDCFQCGHCTTACPAGVQRDILMIALKSKALKKGEPKHLKNYYKAKGISGWNPSRPEKKSIGKELIISGFNFSAGRLLGGLKKHIDKKKFKQSEILFYFGCYIFSHTGAQTKTIQIADHLNLDYEVLGGLRSCCGWPQLMGGRIDEAELLHRHVAKVIQEIQPKVIVTGCVECFASLKRMLQISNDKWEAKTTTQWLLDHLEELNLHPDKAPITFHDSCHSTRKLGLGEAPRKLIEHIAPLVELEKNRDESLCCGYYNFKNNPQLNRRLREEKMEMVQRTGTNLMAVECITCQESFEEVGREKGIEITDLVDLIHRKIFNQS